MFTHHHTARINDVQLATPSTEFQHLAQSIWKRFDRSDHRETQTATQAHTLETDGGTALEDEPTDDTLALHVGDHVRDREDPTQHLLVAGLTDTPANEYCIGGTTTTVADVHPEYDPTDEIVKVAYPRAAATRLEELIVGPVPRGRLKLLTRIQGDDM